MFQGGKTEEEIKINGEIINFVHQIVDEVMKSLKPEFDHIGEVLKSHMTEIHALRKRVRKLENTDLEVNEGDFSEAEEVTSESSESSETDFNNETEEKKVDKDSSEPLTLLITDFKNDTQQIVHV